MFEKLPLNKTPSTREKGQHFESIAERYLQSHGLNSKAKNYHCRLGEIDLVMEHKDTLVFVEVKYRGSSAFGGSISAVSKAKQQKIRKTAAFYLQQFGLNEYNTPCRFDVIALQGEPNNLNVTWLENAF